MEGQQDVKQRVRQAEQLFAQGRIEAARQQLEEILRDAPGDADVLNDLGVIAAGRGDVDVAQRCFTEALANRPESLSAMQNLAGVYRHRQQWDKSAELLEKYVAIDRSKSPILNQLGLSHLKLGNEARAAELLRESLAIEPDQPLIRETLETIDGLEEANAREAAATSYPQLGGEAQPRATSNIVTFQNGQATGGQSPAESSLPGQPAGTPDQPPVEARPFDWQPDPSSQDADPLNILFVQEAPCIRNYKTAKALRARGHRVTLAYGKARLSQVYPSLSDDVYDECIHLSGGVRQLWDLTAGYDVVHCHNEPDTLTVAALAGDAPVIHDTHDLISLRDSGNGSTSYFEGVANRGADGRIYSTPYQRDEAATLYGAGQPSLVFYNYASQDDVPRDRLPKLSARDGRVHIVYEGGVGGTAHRDFTQLFRDLSSMGICVHVYPTFAAGKVRQLFADCPNVEVHPTASPREIMREMSQYDFGIIPFNLEKGNKRFLDSTIANKLFEYLAAGLPVIASPLKSYVDYFRENPVGVTASTASEIQAAIPKLREIAVNTDFSKQVFTYESQAGQLVAFYRRVIEEARTARSGALQAAGRDSKPVEACSGEAADSVKGHGRSTTSSPPGPARTAVVSSLAKQAEAAASELLDGEEHNSPSLSGPVVDAGGQTTSSGPAENRLASEQAETPKSEVRWKRPCSSLPTQSVPTGVALPGWKSPSPDGPRGRHMVDGSSAADSGARGGPTSAAEDEEIDTSLERLIRWLDANGWDGYDPYDVFDHIIQRAKSGNPPGQQEVNDLLKRAQGDPMGVRRELNIAPQRNAKGLGLMTAARVRLYKVTGDRRHLDEARRMADWLLENPSSGYHGLCWGYPFDWQSVIFIPRGTPSAVVSTAVGDGIWELYTITRDSRYLDACEGICRFITEDLRRDDLGQQGLCFSYTPIDDYHVHNANLFCAEFLARIGRETDNQEYRQLARRAAAYALSEQNADGSIFYWGRVQNHYAPDKLDHYHTGFEIRCLWRISQHLKDQEIHAACQRYLHFYLGHFLMEDGTPKITPVNPYPVDIHGAAEAVLMLSTLSTEQPELLQLAERSLRWTISNMQTSEGWFAYRWTPQARADAPFLRWGQAWMLRAIVELCVARKIQSGVWGIRRELSDEPGRKARDILPESTSSFGEVLQAPEDDDYQPSDECAFTISEAPRASGENQPAPPEWWLGVDVKHPIMIVGVGRSGTTLLQAMLNAHPEVCLPPESHFIRDFIANPDAQRVVQQEGLDGVEKILRRNTCLQRLDISPADALEPFRNGVPFSYGDLFKRYLALYASRRGKTIVGEKDPSNTLCLTAMKNVFPEARLVHIIRDPRDVVLSRLKTDMNMHKDVRKWAQNYAGTFQLGRQQGKQLYGPRYTEIFYEQLIQEPEQALDQLCSWLGIAYDPAMLAYQQQAREIVADNEMDWKENVLKPVLKHNCGKWRTGMESTDVQMVESICMDVFSQTPYQPAGPSSA